MRKLGITAIAAGAISFILAVVTRLMPQPVEIPLVQDGVKPYGFLLLAEVCLLFAIAFILLELVKSCKK